MLVKVSISSGFGLLNDVCIYVDCLLKHYFDVQVHIIISGYSQGWRGEWEYILWKKKDIYLQKGIVNEGEGNLDWKIVNFFFNFKDNFRSKRKKL